MESYLHPQVTINNAQQRLLDTVRGSQIYSIVKWCVFYYDDLDTAEKAALAEIGENAEIGEKTLPDGFNISIFMDVAQFDVAKEKLEKTLERHSLNDSERSEISMLNALCGTSVALKGAFIPKFNL